MTHLNHVALLYNSKAGKGRSQRVAGKIITQLQQLSIDFIVFGSDWPGSLEGFSSVFLIGGDGTLNYFINRYKTIDIPIALFKGGSGNDFAWKLYGDLSTEQYLQRALHGQTTLVDAGQCNDRLFLNGFGVGFDGEIVRAMGNRKVISAGHVAYLATVLSNILFYRERQIEWNVEGKTATETPFLMAIANGSRYGGGFNIAPTADITDGLLNVVLVRAIPFWKRIFKIPMVQRGTHLKLPFVVHKLVTCVDISNPQRVPAHLDGELIFSDRFRVSCLPGKFSFLR